MKTYILRLPVFNENDFPKGTIVKITDDYWGKNKSNPNTGFTVIEGELKGKKGCVADGLLGYLLDDTLENRHLIKVLQDEQENIKFLYEQLQKRWDELPKAII